MLAVGDAGTRLFGGLGVAVERPCVVVEAEPADELSVEGSDRALAFAQRCRDALGLPGAHLRVLETIPSHVGLGSGTKLALAVAQALASVHGRSLDAPALAAAAGRAARSAVGMWTFALGGLVVEGGVRGEGSAPLLMRHAMPDEWRIVLVVPDAEPGLSGPAEAQAFERLVPSAERSAAIAQLVLTSLLPALVERELEEFGGALTRVQQLVGDEFASMQGVYGVVGSEEAGRELAARVEGLGAVDVVAFDNRGARVT
jgi:beta-RFAP synthase